MEKILGIILLIIFSSATIYVLWQGVKKIREDRLFKKGRNQFSRICKRCGAQQNRYSYTHNLSMGWWEEVYPVGNNKNCLCHKYANNHG